MRLLVTFLITTAVACGSPSPQVRAPLPELTGGSEEGFVDLTLRAQPVECPRPNGDCAIEAVASADGKRAGLRLVIKGGMAPGFVEGEIDRAAFAREGISFERTGAESDVFLTKLAELYGVPAAGSSFVKREAVTAFPLDGDPSNIKNEPVKFKVFFNDGDTEEKYAELYVNVDLPSGNVELAEKDPEYRENVVRAFGSAR